MSDSREQFEALAKAQGLSVVRTKQALMFANGSQRRPGDYIDWGTHTAWWAWEASRQALEVALPSRSDIKYMEYFPDVEGGVFNERAYLADFRAAIEAAGVRVKP